MSWPCGRRRHAQDDWPALWRRLALAVRQRISRREAARRCGVSDRTLRRWLAGEDLPSPARRASLARMLARLER